MTKVTLNDTDDVPREMISLGVRFKRGVAREVPSHLLAKFQGNSFFTVEGMPYKLSPDASSVIDEDAVIEDDEADVFPDDKEYTLGELLHIAEKRKLALTEAQAGDPNKVMGKIEKNGGDPKPSELVDYTPGA